MNLKKRLGRLEDMVGRNDRLPGVAIEYINGTVSWNDRLFPDDSSFQKAVLLAFKDVPISDGPKVIKIKLYR
jgi:hypothetical protein